MDFNNNSISKTPTIGVISFDAYIDVYAKTLQYVSWKLKSLGCHVVRVGCNGALDACTSLNSLGNKEIIGFDKEPICRRCKYAQSNISAESVCNVDNSLGQLSKDAVYFLENVEKKLRENLMVFPVLEMSYLKLPLCKIAFFDFGITLKLSPTSLLNELTISRFLLGLKDLILLHQHLESVLITNQFTHVAYINGNYSANTLVRLLCERNGILCCSIEPQLTSQRILNYICIKRDRIKLAPEALFGTNSELYIQTKQLKSLLKNFGARITGGDFNAYTSLSGNCNQGETEKLKLFLIHYARVHSFFMSSEDELVPHIVTHDFLNSNHDLSSNVYKNQFEFTQFYLAEAAKNPAIGFILRLHPRMAVNKRDAYESAEHIRYKQLLDSIVISPNVLVILGDNQVSSYFIIMKSDLVIVSWSTIGLESLLMGVPAVSAFPNNIMYPLNNISNQPHSFDDLKIALFSDSKYGIADDMKLFGWASMAYEGQFFPTLAPRGRGGQVGRMYSLIYRIINKVGAYNLFAYIMDKLWIRTVVFSELNLLDQRAKIKTTTIQSSQKLISQYRNKAKKMLDQYEKSIFSFSP